MSNALYMLMALLAGVSVSMQVAVNSKLGMQLGDALGAAFVSFFIGTIALSFYIISHPATLSVAKLTTIDWRWYIGGLLGAAYITISILSAIKMGPALTISLVILGQLIGALVIEHFGYLGVSVNPIGMKKMIGVFMLAGGVVLIKMKPE